MCLKSTPRGQAVQMLTSATSKRGLDREALAWETSLRVKTGPDSPEGNLRELT